MRLKVWYLVLAAIFFTVTHLPAQSTTSLYFPRLVTNAGTGTAVDNSEYTGMAVVNLDTTASATLTFTGYDKTGAMISGSNITNPAVKTLGPGKQLPIVDVEIFGAGLTSKSPVGWIKMDSSVTKVAAFFLVFNGGLTVLDGADVSSNILTSFVLPEIGEAAGFTQIHIPNPNLDPANINFELLSSSGSQKAFVSRTVNGNGTVAETVSELFPGVSIAASDYIRATSSRGVVPFEFIGKTGAYVHGINGQGTSSGATTLYCPQYVVGGSDYISTVSVINLDSTTANLTLDFLKDDGTIISTKTATIDPRGKLHITAQNFFLSASTLTQGYLRITSSGPKLAGSVVFGDPARTKFSAALPLVGSLQSAVVFGQLASNATYFTGAAIINPNTSSATAKIEVFDENAVMIATKDETLTPGQRKSMLLTQFFPALVGQNRSRGYFKVTADRNVASFALFGTNDLSVLSAVPPQIVAGLSGVNYDGSWVGSASTGRAVEFTVAGNVITRFKIGFVFSSGGSTCMTDITISGGNLATISGGTFSFLFLTAGLRTQITGTFTSGSQANGTFGTITLTNYRCGILTVNGTASGGTFTASK